ncbi:hypothetical protein BD310DRAFT_930144 [Dichomitus squalens]|nr:hypothetical protein BD310DRAFT_930144 [Dichomitus squalens]
MPPEKPARYLVRTTELPLSALEHRPHPVVASNERYQVSLGDSAGLTKLGVHYCRLPPGATSTTLHWHSHEDEWFYILEAGEDARLLIWEPGENERADGKVAMEEEVIPREEGLKAGDFIGFKAGIQRAHALKAGEREMVYLLGGSREPLDVSHYPGSGRRQVVDSTMGSVSWMVDDKDIRPSGRKPPRSAVQS